MRRVNIQYLHLCPVQLHTTDGHQWLTCLSELYIVTSMFGVDVRAANPTPERAVTTLRKTTDGDTMVAAIVTVKMARPPTNTARWPTSRAMCCCRQNAYRHAETIHSFQFLWQRIKKQTSCIQLECKHYHVRLCNFSKWTATLDTKLLRIFCSSTYKLTLYDWVWNWP